MQYVHASAPAKDNVALRVGPPRLDGFHPLDTVFEALDLFDDVVAEHLSEPKVTVEISGLGEDLPTDASNLAVKAAELLRGRYGVETGVALSITKRIPVAGGMAGGSADAAATLVACNALWELGLEPEELCELGAELGSDVPFSLFGGLAHGTGRGEELTPVRPGAMHSWVLLTNPQGLSTPDVFREFDAIMGYERVPDTLVADTEELRAALGGTDLAAIGSLMANDLAEAAFSLRPDLREIVRAIGTKGITTILSGSGPTIAVLAEDFLTADALAGSLARDFPELTVLRADGPAAGAHVRDAR